MKQFLVFSLLISMAFISCKSRPVGSLQDINAETIKVSEVLIDALKKEKSEKETIAAFTAWGDAYAKVEERRWKFYRDNPGVTDTEGNPRLIAVQTRQSQQIVVTLQKYRTQDEVAVAYGAATQKIIAAQQQK